MKALVATDYGDTDKLELRTLPDPVVGAGEVRVKIAAASINPVDWKLLSGHAKRLKELTFPAILGRDAAGEILEVGKGVQRLRVGDRVLGLTWGTFAEQVTGDESAWAQLPSGLALDEAAVIPLVGLTGAQLVGVLLLKAGDRILVTGAIGGVGRVAVYAAKKLGAVVIAGVRAKQKSQASDIGADAVVALDDEADIATLPPLDYIADNVGGSTMTNLLPRLKRGGTVSSTVGEPAGAQQLGIRVIPVQTKPDSSLLRELAEAVAQRKLSIPVARRFNLSQGAGAIALARGGGVGKVILVP